MPGMLSPNQMKALAKAQRPSFDHLFLTGMIQHHTGALIMVEDLFATPGAGQDNVLFDFATDIDNTQRAEINIMKGMLSKRKITPRTKMKIASRHLTLALCLTAALPRLLLLSLRRPQTAQKQPPTPPPPPKVIDTGVGTNPRSGNRRSARRPEGRSLRRRRSSFGLEHIASFPSLPGSRRAMCRDRRPATSDTATAGR